MLREFARIANKVRTRGEQTANNEPSLIARGATCCVGFRCVDVEIDDPRQSPPVVAEPSLLLHVGPSVRDAQGAGGCDALLAQGCTVSRTLEDQVLGGFLLNSPSLLNWSFANMAQRILLRRIGLLRVLWLLCRGFRSRNEQCQHEDREDTIHRAVLSIEDGSDRIVQSSSRVQDASTGPHRTTRRIVPVEMSAIGEKLIAVRNYAAWANFAAAGTKIANVEPGWRTNVSYCSRPPETTSTYSRPSFCQHVADNPPVASQGCGEGNVTISRSVRRRCAT